MLTMRWNSNLLFAIRSIPSLARERVKIDFSTHVRGSYFPRYLYFMRYLDLGFRIKVRIPFKAATVPSRF